MLKVSTQTELFFRYLANFGLLIGQAILLYSDIRLGIIVKIISALILLYFMVLYKLWDMVMVLTAFTILDLSKLLHLKFMLNF